jgi:hypothetical protein
MSNGGCFIRLLAYCASCAPQAPLASRAQLIAGPGRAPQAASQHHREQGESDRQ